MPMESPELLNTMRVAEDVVVTKPLVGLVGMAEEDSAVLAALGLDLMQSPTPEAEAVAVLTAIPTSRGVMGALIRHHRRACPSKLSRITEIVI